MNDNFINIIQEADINDLEKIQKILSDFISEKKNKLNSSLTLFKYSIEYKEYISLTFSKKYLISVSQSFKHLIKFFGEEKKLEEITAREAEIFKTNLQKTAPKGAAIYVRTLKASFNKALEWDYLTLNPFSKIKIRKYQQSNPLFITRIELQKILDNTINEKMKQIFIFTINTGCRLNEVVNMKWSNVDLEKQIIIVGDDSFETKNKKTRTIPFSPELKLLLPELKRNAKRSYQYVFHKDIDFPYCGDYVSKQFKKAVREAGLSEKIHFHTLRHSFGSIRADIGSVPTVVQEMMGHAYLTTTQLYFHTNLENMQREISKFPTV